MRLQRWTLATRPEGYSSRSYLRYYFLTPTWTNEILLLHFPFFEQIELQPIANVFPALNHDHSVRALECDINEVESRFDDLCQAKDLVLKYQETESDLDQDMRKFNSEITKTLRTFRSAISTLDAKKVDTCLEVYADSLDGNDEEGKFVRHWKDMMKAKVCNLSLKK